MKTWKLLLAAMMALVMLFAVSALAEETPTEPGPGPACTEEDHAALEWVTVKEPPVQKRVRKRESVSIAVSLRRGKSRRPATPIPLGRL